LIQPTYSKGIFTIYKKLALDASSDWSEGVLSVRIRKHRNCIRIFRTTKMKFATTVQQKERMGAAAPETGQKKQTKTSGAPSASGGFFSNLGENMVPTKLGYRAKESIV
jgi:hypothetical protein